MKSNLLRRGLVGMLALMLIPGMCPVNVMASEMVESSEQQSIVTEDEAVIPGEGEVLVDELAEDTIQANTFEVAIISPGINYIGENYVLKAKPIGVGNLNPDNYTYEWFEYSIGFWNNWEGPNYLHDGASYAGTHTDTLAISAEWAEGLGGRESMWYGCRVTSKYPLDEPNPSKRERHSSEEMCFIPEARPKMPYSGPLWFTDLDKPVAGATPDYTGKSKDPSLFEFERIEWFRNDPSRSDRENLMQPTDKFEVGSYKCRLHYHMGAGLYPTGSVNILQNGEIEVVRYYEDDHDFMTSPKRYLEAYYDVKNELTNISFSCLAAPVEGRALDTSVLSTAGLKVTSVAWSPADTKAVAGKEYTVTIVVEAQDGYRIADDANVTVNDNSAKLIKYSNNVWHVEYTFPAAASFEKNPALLSDRNLFMNVSDVFVISGKGIALQGKPQYGVVNKGDALRLTYFDQAQVKSINVTVQDLEIKNDIYNLLIGTPFGTNADGSVNKGTLTAGAVLQKKEQYVEASSLALLGTLQTLSGMSAATAREGSDITCTIGGKNYNAKILSLNGKDIASRGVTVENVVIGDFDVPHLSYLGQTFELKTGGRTIGTFTVKGENTSIDQFVTKVSVNVTAPEVGKAPVQDATIADGSTGFRVASVSWSPVSSSFAANTEYTVTIKAFADYSKIFSKNVAVFINGKMVTPTSGEETDTLIFSYTFPKLSVAPDGPQITTQPADQTVEVGAKASFKVVAAGEGLTYQWKVSVNNGTSWTTPSAALAKTANYSFAAKATQNGYLFKCVITDAKGKMVETNAVKLTVKTNGPVIITQPTAQTVNDGAKVTFKVAAAGEGLTYQWKVSANNGTSWSAPTSTAAKGATYSFTAKSAHNGYLVKCVITDANGKSIESSAVKLTVKAGGPVISTQPAAQTVADGAKATFKVAAAGEGLTYQWKVSANNGISWSAPTATAAKSATYSFTAKSAHNGYLVKCVITDANGKSVESNAVKLTVKSNGPVITTQPVAQSVVSGAKATFKVVATGEGLTYQWKVSANNGSSWSTPTAAATKTATYSFTTKAAQNGYLFKCVVTDANGKIVESNVVKLTVK